MSDAIVLQFYVVVSVLMAGIFLAACAVLSHKYKTRRDRRHFWAAVAFALLAAQEMIVIFWLWAGMADAASLAARPWHIQQASVLVSFVLLALAMFGRIRD